MAGINTLFDVYEQKGDAFLKRLLNEYVIINKKLSGSFFGVSVGPDSVMRFYKKGGEITKIDRILMRYYDKAISQMESLTSEVLTAIPENYVFGMEYVNSSEDDEDVLNEFAQEWLNGWLEAVQIFWDEIKTKL